MPEHFRIKSTVEGMQWLPDDPIERTRLLDWAMPLVDDINVKPSGVLVVLSHGFVKRLAPGDWLMRGWQEKMFKVRAENIGEYYEWAPPWFINIIDDGEWSVYCSLDCHEYLDDPGSNEEDVRNYAREHVRTVHS